MNVKIIFLFIFSEKVHVYFCLTLLIVYAWYHLNSVIYTGLISSTNVPFFITECSSGEFDGAYT
jgi:hypothetical protein